MMWHRPEKPDLFAVLWWAMAFAALGVIVLALIGVEFPGPQTPPPAALRLPLP